MPYLKLLIIIPILILTIYLNQAYANFFNRIGEKNLPSPYSGSQEFQIGKEGSKSQTYVALGDSLTAGVGANNVKETFPYQYAEKISSQSSVLLVNKGYPGAKISQILSHIEPTKQLKPQLITIFIGINDAFNRTPLESFKNDYEHILSELETTNANIILINIPYLGTKQSVPYPYPFIYEWQISRYNKVIKELAAAHPKVKLFDLHSLTASEFQKDNSYYSIDQFHPSAKGYILWSDLLYKFNEANNTNKTNSTN